MGAARLDQRTVLVASGACGLRDELATELRSAGASVLVADSHASAARLLRAFRCDAVVCIVGSPAEGIRSLPHTHPEPRYVAVDASGGSGELEGFDAVVPLGVASTPCALRLRLVDVLCGA